MKKGYVFLVLMLSGFFTLAIGVSVAPVFGQAMAAPGGAAEMSSNVQAPGSVSDYLGVSALAFEPTRPDASYTKDLQRQILSLTGQNLGSNLFVAPLSLPDRSELLGLTMFGEDFDNQGEIRLRLKRCDHGQARCLSLAEASSTSGFAAGQFETARVSVPNEIVDNRFYSYFLELELTALFNSGLRSVRLELSPRGGATPVGNQERWTLAGDVRSFPIPTLDLAQVRICTDDLSHLNNITHNPFIVVERDRVIPLSSNSCVTVWGHDIQIQRQPNTGPSSGTYQVLR
jgi:hypothetical protein